MQFPKGLLFRLQSLIDQQKIDLGFYGLQQCVTISFIFAIKYDHLQFTASSVVSSLHDPSFETVCKFTLSAKFEYFTEILNYSCVLIFLC